MIENQQERIFQYAGLFFELHSEVYDPAEDSFLLAEGFEVQPGSRILELGSGCGLIALTCAKQGAHVVCTDLNPYAIHVIKRNYTRNKHLLSGTVDIRQGDLFSVIKKNEYFDCIVFNPPYLPTKPKEKVSLWFDTATDGGPDGLLVISRFIKNVKNHLEPHGKAYFIFSSLASEQKLIQVIKKEKFEYQIIKNQRFEDETLYVYGIYSDRLK